MNEQSESSSSSLQVNSQNNYKYDEYGFIQVNSIEDLLYDKFNNHMENRFKIKKIKKNKKPNDNLYNSSRNYQSIYNYKRIKNDENQKMIQDNDHSMKIILSINNKEKKAFRINPFEDNSIESMTIKDKESDTKNDNNKNKNSNNLNKVKKSKNKDINKQNNKKKEKKDKNKLKKEKDEQFTFNEVEAEKKGKSFNCVIKAKKNKSKSKSKKRNSKELINDNSQEEYSENESDIKINIIASKRKSKSKPKNLKQNSILNQNSIFSYSQPILLPCIMTKIRKVNPSIMQAIPKTNREFITKTYEKEDTKINKKGIISWPNSTICYFNRSNKIINVNIHIPLQNVINRNYFCTKEIINSDKMDKNELLENNVNNNKEINEGDSNNIVIQIENSAYKYGKINIKTRSGNKSNSKSKSYIFKIKGSKAKLYNEDSSSNSKCLKNREIRKALIHNLKKSKKKSKSKKKTEEEMDPGCITLHRRKNFADKLYKKIMRKKTNIYPPDCKILIKTKFKNNLMNNYRMSEIKKEEEKINRNNSMNRFDIYKKKFISNNNNVVYPSIRKLIYEENTKNKNISSFLREPRFNESFNIYRKYNTNYRFNNSNNNISQNFPAINSYFH